MRERPILMSAPMVRATLSDVAPKTQTRRVVKGTALEWLESGYSGDYVALPENHLCPYGVPGDRLYVKEAVWMWCERRPNGKTKTGRDKWHYVPLKTAPLHYAADHPKKPAVDVVSPVTDNRWGWRLKVARFMPRWACRIVLEVTSRRVEYLQEISTADCIAEGAPGGHGAITGYHYAVTPIEHYRRIWEDLNGFFSWIDNPRVWVVSFQRLEGGAA